jgi:hypothetical protein
MICGKFILRFDDFKKKKELEVKDEIFKLDLESDVLKKSDLKISFKAVRYVGYYKYRRQIYGTEL